MNRTIRNSALVASSLLAIPALAACGAGEAATGDTLTFAAIPAESSQSLQSDFANIVELLEQEAGVSIEFQNASDYAAVIEGQRAGQIDMASYGPFSYVIAKDSGVDIEAVAAPTNDKDTAPAYTSLAYVREDSDINSLEDIDGQEVCFVDAASTSGYLVPMKGLMDADKSMDDDMTQVLAGGHDASLLSLDSGNCEVAFAHDAMLETLVESGHLEDGAVRSIWELTPSQKTQSPFPIPSTQKLLTRSRPPCARRLISRPWSKLAFVNPKMTASCQNSLSTATSLSLTKTSTPSVNSAKKPRPRPATP